MYVNTTARRDYDEMMSFSEWQRAAICQAEISKSGLVVSNIQMDFDMFFQDVSDVMPAETYVLHVHAKTVYSTTLRV